ncbi:MAG TPA: deoxyguanosinetriphosphate triphosphohydrolase [Actinomycetota bacterium]|nr:deoxyguanosinetriphosphate triphosphohydrolase [Actinomycetota bacterium]
MDIRQEIEEREKAYLSPSATLSSRSTRAVTEEPHPFRTAFQRDRDRILHCKAFRRLAHKTQVFLAPEGDHYRVRLTHTLEVTQIARTLARALRLNEDLAEAICLGHDLGHTPFGHLGEEVLSEFMGKQFRHNEQSLRIVDLLEMRGSRPGLNLTNEVRDGILNHTWSMPMPKSEEAKIARFADRIAYISHDIDDAIRAGVLTSEELPEITRRVLGKTPSDRIDTMAGSVVAHSISEGEVGMEDDVLEALNETRAFMFESVYQRPEVRAEQLRAVALLEAVLAHYVDHPDQIEEGGEDDDQARVVDYVAGMTDRFALRQYQRIIGTS